MRITLEKTNSGDEEKKEFRLISSKKILFYGFIALAIISAFTLYYVWVNQRDEPLLALIGIFGVCFTAAVSFYFWKERSNNNFKYAEEFIERMADKYGIEPIVEILSSLLSNNNSSE